MELNVCGIIASSNIPKPEILGPGGKRTLTPKKGIQVEGIRSWTYVEFVRPMMPLKHATPNIKRYLYYFSY